MQVFVSLWSADLLDLGRAIDVLEPVADGIHLDVFDGHNVDELLFGPDLVAAVKGRTRLPVEVHLNVTDPDHWSERFIGCGADIVTVQSGPCPDVEATLGGIRAAGAMPSLGIEIHESVEDRAELGSFADRFLLLGSRIGVKGASPDARTPDRVRRLIQVSQARGTPRPVVVDGAVRAESVGLYAEAGADGVVPGSLVFGAPDVAEAVRCIHALH
jgi:ribulose-phosphate 3-epimerase